MMRQTGPAGIFLMVGVLLIAGCGPFTLSTHSTTLSGDGTSSGQVIYRISEETAFTTVLDAFAVLLPDQGVDDIVDGSRRGYNVAENFGASHWYHRILVVHAIGTDAGGNEVHGYWYDYSGGGDNNPHLKARLQKRMGLLEFIRARLDPGTTVAVSNLRDSPYETNGFAYLGLKRDARDIRPWRGTPREK